MTIETKETRRDSSVPVSTEFEFMDIKMHEKTSINNGEWSDIAQGSQYKSRQQENSGAGGIRINAQSAPFEHVQMLQVLN